MMYIKGYCFLIPKKIFNFLRLPWAAALGNMGLCAYMSNFFSFFTDSSIIFQCTIKKVLRVSFQTLALFINLIIPMMPYKINSFFPKQHSSSLLSRILCNRIIKRVDSPFVLQLRAQRVQMSWYFTLDSQVI